MTPTLSTIYRGTSSLIAHILLLELQIPLRTLQRPLPAFNPNRACVHFIFVVVISAHTLLGPASLYSYSVIMLSGLWLFIVTSARTLLGPVCCVLIYTYLILPKHFLCTLYCKHRSSDLQLCYGLILPQL